MTSSPDAQVKASGNTAIRSTSVSGTLTTTAEDGAKVHEPDSLERRSLSCPLQGSARHHVCSRKAMHQMKRQDSSGVHADDKRILPEDT